MTPETKPPPELKDYKVIARIRASSKPDAVNQIAQAVKRVGGHLVGGGASEWRDG